MKKCKNCGAEMPDELNFCGKCGATLSTQSLTKTSTATKKCRSCGFEMREDEIFCGNCGVTYAQSGQPQQPAPAKSNKKLISIIGGIAGLVVLIIIIAVASNSGEDSRYTSSSNYERTTTYATTTPAETAPIGGVTVKLINNTGEMLTQLYIAPDGAFDSDDWGADMLTGFQYWSSSTSVTIDFSEKQLKDTRYWNLRVLSLSNGYSFSKSIDLWHITEIYIELASDGSWSIKCL